MNDQLYISGEIMAFFYENPLNFYKVCLVQVEDTNSEYEENEIVITGTFGQLHEGISYRFYGQLVSHPKYGQQFQATSYEQVQPTGAVGLIKYLASEHFPGIGEKTAKRIVDTLGLNALELIIEDETALQAIPGLTKAKQQMIRENVLQQQGTEKVLLLLTNSGFSVTLAHKIILKYRDKAMDIIQENPYRLIQDIEGVGFKRADALAQQAGIPPHSIARLKGAIYYAIQEICFQLGHTYVEIQVALMQAQKIAEQSQAYLIDIEYFEEALQELERENCVISYRQQVALNILYYAESGIATSMQRLKRQPKKEEYDAEDIRQVIEVIQKEEQIEYGQLQKKAIQQALVEPVSILTGGPGTGKTTVIKGIVAAYCLLNDVDIHQLLQLESPLPVILAAPTGRAAKRMSEVTGLPAMTIHRLLGLTGQEELQDNLTEWQIDGSLLIVDEMSMVDTWLMNRLCKAIPNGMNVLFVGDKDQLASVGPGQVLKDLLDSNRLAHVELDRIFRQDEHSTIISLAHTIKTGQLPDNFTVRQADRSYLPATTASVSSVVEQVVKKAMTKGYTKRDIQVLAPMYRGEAGIIALNKVLQQLFNPLTSHSRQVEFFDQVFRVGDKVLQLVNQTEVGVFNGDIGEIIAIQFAKENEDKVDKVFVAFDAVEVEYARSEWNQLTLAYCCSIHKAQGSEFKMVILPLVSSYHRMLQRNLLYTAVTRSKQLLILCGEQTAFQQAVQTETSKRQTFLYEFLTGEVESRAVTTVQEDYVLTMELIESNTIDALIGMEGKTPYDFM